CNLAAAQASEFGISRGSRVLQFASFSFDASVSEVFTALVSGATLCVAPDPRALSSELLVNVLREREINVVTLPPAVLAVTTPERLPALRTVVSAGESCSPETVARWGRHCRVINAYGPTENTVCATMHECVEADVDVVPIGRPMRNTTLYLLDALLQPAPVNVTGEAYVGGAGVARGYLNRPGLTAERFIPDPFSAEPGARLYRTGDAARYRGDGEVEFVGRLDGQVKVRGYRVELGEVEAALASHAAVRDVVVMARDDEQGGPKQLVAYVVADQSRPAPAAAELREHAREQLPDYMTPSAFVLLEEMPLTPNGKVDRRALPAPYQVEAEQGAAADPRTPFEEMLCGIAADVLNLERVRVTDNFFEVGGHSLLATQFILRLREVLRVELSVRDLFEKPTIAQAAAEVEARLRAGEGEGVPPIERASRGGGLPASFAQQRLWFLDQLEGGSHAAYNMPGAFRLRGALDLEALGRTLSEVVRRHEVLRTSFATAADGTPVQVIHAPQ
ncbi:MAG TPA: AMP-binding protein, partial [Pyrinomonadaceae bacterium]